MAPMRETPAIRNRSAKGSGLWWKDVETIASSMSSDRSRATVRARARRSWRAVRLRSKAHGSPPPARLRAAAGRPLAGGELRKTTLRPLAATARTSGPVRGHRPCCRAGPPGSDSSSAAQRQVHGIGHGGADLARRGHLVPARRGRRGDEYAAAPAASAAATSLSMSPTTTHLEGSTRSARAADSTMPGAGLRQRHPSSVPCGQICTTSNGPARCSTRAFTATTSSIVSAPRAMPDWFDRTPTGTPLARSRSSAGRTSSISSTRSGSPLYGTSFTSVPSRSKSTAAGYPGPGPLARWLRSPADGASRRTSATRRRAG